MNNSGNNFFRHTLYTGIVLGVVCIIYYLLIYLTNQMANQWVAWMLFPFLFVISAVAVFYFRKKYSGGFLSFSRGFNLSYLPYLYGFIMNSVFHLLYMQRIMTPDYVNKIIEQTTTKLKAQGLNQKQIDASATVTRFFFEHPMWGIGISLLSFALMGAIISVILAAVARKENEKIAFEDI